MSTGMLRTGSLSLHLKIDIFRALFTAFPSLSSSREVRHRILTFCNKKVSVMRIAAKGQVTIPQNVRERAGLMPGMDALMRGPPAGGDEPSAGRMTNRHPPYHSRLSPVSHGRSCYELGCRGLAIRYGSSPSRRSRHRARREQRK
jgi:hypothetical protein